MTDKLLIGAHTSAAGGAHKALLHGQRIGATTIQLFTSNQRQWAGKPISTEELERWKKAREETGLKKIMSHASYLMNLGAPNPENLIKSRKALVDEVERCHQLELSYMNFHPGAALTDSVEQCLDRIIESLLTIEELTSQGPTRLLLEATAGQGSTVGHEFAHLAHIIRGVEKKIPIGVCIDTCHIFAAGYDLRNKEAWDATLKEFDEVVGLKHLYAIHVNDSKFPLGARKDRHASLGKGEIGNEGFKAMMQNPKLRDLPKYLETPNTEIWSEEIQILRDYAK
ncbi:MAG: deoxyribonuclease IV [Candidatus Algichlamydia australiensis]|nr:deoxyribonuclease IV [Chlamydiales bacterium]